MNKLVSISIALLACTLAISRAEAQNTLVDMEVLTVNENITTVITSSEPIRLVDISTDKVAGDQPISNTIRLKPKEKAEDGDILGIVTIVTERYRTQYGLVYTSCMQEAVSDKEITLQERHPYHNPVVSMSMEDLYACAHRIWASPAAFRDVSYSKHRMKIRLNNIYCVGDYFFLDFSIENGTNIRFDIDEIRVKLHDKKIAKATNSQTIELKPELVLDRSVRFSRGYRNVIAIRKMTFPNDKILTIEISEKQISGRTMKLSIDYEDVLSADSFNETLLEID